MPAPERSSVTRGSFPAARPTVASHESALLPEPILTVHEYLMKAGQDDPEGLVSETTCSSRHGGLAERAVSTPMARSTVV